MACYCTLAQRPALAYCRLLSLQSFSARQTLRISSIRSVSIGSRTMASSCPSLPMLTGKPMPQVGLGTWQSDKGEVAEAVRIAIDAGYRHIDTARGYMNEGEIGDALEECIKAGKVTREEMFITTKLSGGSAVPRRVKEQADKSLKALRTDYIDLLLIHFPIAFSDVKIDEEPPVFFPSDEDGNRLGTDTKPIETYREMEKLVDAGLVKALGLSNFNKDQVQKVWEGARIKPSNLQCECHAWFPQDELANFCKEKGITFSAYGPIGSPGRPGAASDDAQVLLKDPVVNELAKAVNKTPAQVLLRYLMQKGTIVLPKSVNKERIVSNFELFDFTLSDEQMDQLKGINKEQRLFSFVFIKNLFDHPNFPWKIVE